MKKEFYSNGKLLLTGEYAVLDGAKSLALPTKFGQTLSIIKIGKPELIWKSLDEKGDVWFECYFDLKKRWYSKDPHISKIQQTLTEILIEAKKMNPDFLSNSGGFEVETRMSFPRDWGLGSSSTLINNIALWANVDPYQLLGNTFGGSGYDIACAQHNYPIAYQLKNGRPKVEKVVFDPEFKESLFFVHLNKKQDSREGITQYKKLKIDTDNLTKIISGITDEIIACETLVDFETLISKHESVISNALQIPTIKDSLFPEFKGSIKSLGAWGGDFILATGNEASMAYFRIKGYSTIIPYAKMIL